MHEIDELIATRDSLIETQNAYLSKREDIDMKLFKIRERLLYLAKLIEGSKRIAGAYESDAYADECGDEGL